MMDASLRALVFARADNRCEYCRITQRAASYSDFQIEHIRARQHGGDSHSDNLCLACRRCNLYKGPNQSAYDPLTNTLVPLFNPRSDSWAEHFRLNDVRIEGLTPVGRATVELLRMNDERRVRLRRQLRVERN